uniref:Aldehyde reductase 2 n=1 Tax=Talaromyces marneffei PM1 TaxID=1077442 RepID=A0A093Y6C6_TALMA
MESRPSMNGNDLDQLVSDREEIVIEDRFRPTESKSSRLDENTPLHIAIRNEDYAAIEEALQDHGANINDSDSRKAALRIALDDRNLRLLEMLMPFRPDLELKGSNGRTPLHLTVATGWKEGTKLLIRYYSDVNATDDDGNMPLHFACSAGHRGITRLLLESGANVHIRDSNGRTPLQLALASRTNRLPELILQYIANTDDVRHRGDFVDYDEPDSPGKRDPAAEISRGTEQDLMGTTGASDIDSVFAKFSQDHWDGVRRDNGDGFILANYDNHEIFFDAKVESIRLLMHEGQEMHALQLKLNFMKPFATRNRIRYAKVDAKLAASDSGNIPHIHSIMPQADRVEVSEQEISSGQTLTVGASGGGGPSNVNISMEGSKSRKSTFKGVRIIHGVVKDRMHASWRMYEEPGSQSGLPEIVRLLLLVQCKAEFDIRLSMSVKACHVSSFGIPRTLAAKSALPYRVPDVTTMLKLERATKLKNILNVADRAATSVEEATMLEREFAQSIKNHSKKALIMEAGSQDEFVREWGDIADASREGDFSFLQQKLMQMTLAERVQRATERLRIQPERRSTRIMDESPPNRRRFERIRKDSEDLDYQRRFLDRRDFLEPVRKSAVDFLSRERPYNSQVRNAMESFSAITNTFPGARILVTGANGYIASNVVDVLLSLGYLVRGTVREEKPWLVELFESKYGSGTFETVIVPHLDDQEALLKVLDGVSGVVHLATDVSFNADPNVVITKVVAYTEAILKAADKATVKRVVLTSSSASAFVTQPGVEDIVVTEDTWNDAAVKAAWDENTPAEAKPFIIYSASKTEGERAAWNWVKENKPGFTFNAVLPNLVLGKVVHPNIKGSTMKWVAALLEGNADVLSMLPPQHYVNVEDVARIHAIALLDPNVNSERLFAFAAPYTWVGIIDILKRLRPSNDRIPSPPANELPDLSQVVPAKRAEELLKSFFAQRGWVGLEETVKAGIESLGL